MSRIPALPDTATEDRADVQLARLLASTSVELSPADEKGVLLLPEYWKPGTLVHITFLPNEKLSRIVETAAALGRKGFVPVPHIAARSLKSRAELEDLIARAVGEAGVKDALLIGGDVDAPRGAFSSSLEVLQTGILQKHGVHRVAFAGHPEGHPSVGADVMRQAIRDKVRFALAEGFSVKVINQLCFEPEPLLRWIGALREDGIEAPVWLGIAAPTSAQTMLRFALRCGVGNSIRTLRKRTATVERLLSDEKPDELLKAVSRALPEAATSHVEGLHFFAFGGIRKLGAWLRDFKAQHRSSEGAHHE